MAAELPDALTAAIAALMEGRSRKDLSERSGKISRRYREGGSSTGVVEGEADAMAYAVARMPATFAAASEVFERLLERCPEFARNLWQGWRSLEEYAREVFPVEERANSAPWVLQLEAEVGEVWPGNP